MNAEDVKITCTDYGPPVGVAYEARFEFPEGSNAWHNVGGQTHQQVLDTVRMIIARADGTETDGV